MLYNVLGIFWCFWGVCCSWCEDGGAGGVKWSSTSIRNIGKLLPDCMMSQPKWHTNCCGCVRRETFVVQYPLYVLQLCYAAKQRIWCTLVTWLPSAFCVFMSTVVLSLICSVHVADITTRTGCVPESSGTESTYPVPFTYCQGTVHTLAAHEAVSPTARSDR